MFRSLILLKKFDLVIELGGHGVDYSEIAKAEHLSGEHYSLIDQLSVVRGAAAAAHG